MDFTRLKPAEQVQYLAHAPGLAKRIAITRARIERKLQDPGRAHQHDALRARLAEYDETLAEHEAARAAASAEIKDAAMLAEMEQTGGGA